MIHQKPENIYSKKKIDYIHAREDITKILTKNIKEIKVKENVDKIGNYRKVAHTGPNTNWPTTHGPQILAKILSLLFIFSQNLWPIGGPFSWASLCWATYGPQKISIR